jgi:hypothetical protein
MFFSYSIDTGRESLKKMSSSLTCESTGESKTSSNNTNAAVVFTDLLGIVNHGYSLTWCKSIFAYLGPTAEDTVSLRSYCKLFSKALKPLPKGSWTSFPHPKYSTLNGLVGRLNHLRHDYVDIKVADISIGLKVYFDHPQLYKDHTIISAITKINPDGTYNIKIMDMKSVVYEIGVTEKNNVPLSKLKQRVIHILPSLLFIDDGVHDEGGELVTIKIPISIIGESREHCIVIGGLQMGGKKEDDVNVSNLTLRDSKMHGVYGNNGASIHLDNVSVENSGKSGVVVSGTKRSTMKNCNVSYSKRSGLIVNGGGSMTIDGNGTTIHHNCWIGRSGDYGLKTSTSSSSIHLASSLTIETISKNNGGGGNHGGKGTIITIRSKEQRMSCIDEQGRLRVTPGVNSLANAVYEAHIFGITDLFLLNGEHDEKGGSVIIDYSVSIIGESREHCIVMGGLDMGGHEKDDVNVSNLTLRDSKGSGVCGRMVCGYDGASFHLDNVSVENSGRCGVNVYGTKRSTMKNCNVSHSKLSGLVVQYGLMTIDGNGTTIHHNGTNGYGYGLYAQSSGSIHLVSPLTKEMISTNNHVGRNYGGNIQTITNNTKEEKKN